MSLIVTDPFSVDLQIVGEKPAALPTIVVRPFTVAFWRSMSIP
jgi:hypothetical protein